MTDPEQVTDWVPALLQVSDPLFPTGAYAHSMGLEQWAETCGYRTADDLIGFFSSHAGPSLARLELPYLRFTLDLLAQDEVEELYALEAEIDAWKMGWRNPSGKHPPGPGPIALIGKNLVGVCAYR